jgi:2-dehydro-3-deoxygluconokinase
VNRTPYAVTLGETMALISAARPGPLAHAATLDLGIGGSESNVAIGLQRLGVQAVWCGRVGADSLGELVQREIRAEGVDVRAAVDPSASTGLMLKERRTPGLQRVSYYRSASAGSRLAPTDLDPGLIEGAALLHVTGITPALSASASDALFHAVRTAKAAGVPVSFDLNYRAKLWAPEAAAAVYRTIIPLADMVFAGTEEAEIAVGPAAGPEELARRIAAMGPSQAIIKLGADGALALVDGTVYRQAAVAVDVVDTVGAGDAFVAGYLAGVLTSEPVETRLSTAAATGAFACLVPGDWEGFPRREELSLLLSSEPVLR